MSVVSRGIEVLTNRERQVAELVFQGLANKEIARELALSERTVESHVASICNRLGFRSRVQIATWVAQQPGRAGAVATLPEPAARPRAGVSLPAWPVLVFMLAGVPLPFVAIAYQWSQFPASTGADLVLDVLTTIAALGWLAVPGVSLAAVVTGRGWGARVAIIGLLSVGIVTLLLAGYAIALAWASPQGLRPADPFELAYTILVAPLLLIHIAALVSDSRQRSWARALITICAAFWILRFGYGLTAAALVLWLLWAPGVAGQRQPR